MWLKPTADGPTTAGYASFFQLQFPDMRPYQLGHGTPTPSNTIGNIGHKLFNKNMPIMPIKNIIKFQITSS